MRLTGVRLLALVFGRGRAAVGMIAGIAVFFPSLVNMVFHLRYRPVPAHGG
ncbi:MULTISPECIES: hypothetical protein [unclassified Frankia]